MGKLIKNIFMFSFNRKNVSIVSMNNLTHLNALGYKPKDLWEKKILGISGEPSR